MDLDEFLTKYDKEIKLKVLTEDCANDFFDMILEMSRSDQKAIVSYTELFYTHMLKYEFQPYKQTKSWINSMRKANFKLKTYRRSKALWNSIIKEDKEKAYQDSRKDAQKETKLDINTFPKEMPDEYQLDYAIDNLEDFLVKYA